MQRNLSNKGLLAFLIVFTNIVPPLTVDEYTPSIPHMIAPLHTTEAMMQLTVTFYMLGFAIAQIICGSLSDAFGRRKVLLSTFPIFFVGTLICVFAHSGLAVIIGRVLQGLGVGAMALTGPAMMSDCFEGKALHNVSALYGTVYSFIPIAAPALGGFIQDYFGWQANFVFMFILGVIIYTTFAVLLPETHPVEKRNPLSVGNIKTSYIAVLTNRKYMLAVLALVLTWSTFVVFSIMAPFLMQNELHYSPAVYGLLALLVAVGFLVGNLLNNFLLKMMSLNKILFLGFLMMAVASLIQVILPLMGYFNVYSVMIPSFMVMAGSGLTFPHLYGIGASAVPQYAGTAGALIGSLILVGAVIVTAVITQLQAHSPVAMASAFLVLSALCLVLYKMMQRDIVA